MSYEDEVVVHKDDLYRINGWESGRSALEQIALACMMLALFFAIGLVTVGLSILPSLMDHAVHVLQQAAHGLLPCC